VTGGGATGDAAGRSEADALLASFAAWAAGARADEAAAARTRERWLRQQAAEAATWAGTLVDLAEIGADAVVMVGTRSLSGRLVAAGDDLCVVAERGRATIVALAHVRAVRVVGHGGPVPAGARSAALSVRLADALAALAAERAPVHLGVAGGERISGDLLAVGIDVLTVRAPLGQARVHVALAAVETCTPA
jgi:hypothetical protein